MSKKTEIAWIVLDLMYLLFLLSSIVILCLYGWQWFSGIRFYGVLAIVLGFEAPDIYRFIVKKWNQRKERDMQQK